MANGQPGSGVSVRSAIRREIGEQPEVVARLLDRERAHVANLVTRWRRQNLHYITIVARGSSDNAATYGKYVFGVLNNIMVALAAPSLYTLYDARPNVRQSLVMAISQDGESPDLLAVVTEAKKQNAPTLAITNAPGSRLASLADEVLVLEAGEESPGVATKTFTASIGALALIGAAWAGSDSPSHLDELMSVPEKMSQALEVESQIRNAAPLFAGIDRALVIGRGFNYCTAFEIALKLKELTYLAAEPYSSADFRYGPMAMVDENLHALVVAPSGRTHEDAIDLTRQLKRERAHVIGISDEPAFLALADVGWKIPSTSEWLSPLVAAVPGQLLALHVAEVKGHDVEDPRGAGNLPPTT
jgi:glucosamine--fructose-6-phosphate aminotransferase (isomerizing)